MSYYIDDFMIRPIGWEPDPVYTDSLVDILVVGAGGGGGTGISGVSNGGGGGGGEVIYLQGYELLPGTYDVEVGLGGAANTNGGQSSFDGITAEGGGKGGSGNPKGDGGSGANGGGGTGGGTIGIGGTGTSGNNGGAGVGANTYSGGGGAGQYNAGNTYGIAVGGLGFFSSISGTYLCYGPGGGGASNTLTPYTQPGAGTSGIGAGGNAPNGQGGGGGGGNGGYGNYPGGRGGDGTVIIRYKTGSRSATGGTVTYDGDYTIHTFASSGTLTVN